MPGRKNQCCGAGAAEAPQLWKNDIVCYLVLTYKLKYVFVGHLRQAVDALFRQPRLFVLQGKYFDGHVFPAQLALPHRSEPAASLDLQQLNRSKHLLMAENNQQLDVSTVRL